MWTPDYFVRSVKLPKNVDGVVVPNDDGTFDIYLNASQPRELQEKWLRHEINHIREDHFYRALSIVSIEREADGIKPEEAKPDLPVSPDKIMEFKSLQSMLNYYWNNPDRILRDYG